MDEILQINNLNYQQYTNFSMSIKKEKFISIIGSNNSGKTTLFKIISGVIPTNSVVTCDEIDLCRQNVNDYIKQLGIVFKCQKDSFLFTTVYEEMSYPLKNLGYCESYIKRRINKVLSLFSLEIKDKRISELTNYERQVLLFCIALLHQPRLLLIDNVFSFMNKNEALMIIKVLKSIKKLSIINFTSNLEFINQSDYIYLLENGEIVLEGSYQDLLKEDKLLMKFGIEIPFVINLSIKLKEKGLIDDFYNNLDELVDEIWK